MTPAPSAVAALAAEAIAHRSGVPRHDVAVVTGSGWVEAADLLGEIVADLPARELPGFAAPGIEGHPARVRSVLAGDRRALVFVGRTHLYEGRGVDAVAHHVRVAAAAGCRAVVLTNGCGGLRVEWPNGSLVLIRDHLNLTGTSPLPGASFVNMVDAYSPRLRERALEVEPGLPQGVYAQLRGPQYETPAEIGMLAVMGADLVGMSTALETIAARALGLEVLGLSLVTNLAAGITGEPITPDEVAQTGRESSGRVGDMLARILRVI